MYYIIKFIIIILLIPILLITLICMKELFQVYYKPKKLRMSGLAFDQLNNN